MLPLPDLHLAPALHPPPNHPFAAVFNLNSKVPQRKSQPLHTSHITCTIQPSCCSSTGQATCFRTSSQRRSTNGRRSSATFPSSPYTLRQRYRRCLLHRTISFCISVTSSYGFSKEGSAQGMQAHGTPLGGEIEIVRVN